MKTKSISTSIYSLFKWVYLPLVVSSFWKYCNILGWFADCGHIRKFEPFFYGPSKTPHTHSLFHALINCQQMTLFQIVVTRIVGISNIKLLYKNKLSPITSCKTQLFYFTAAGAVAAWLCIYFVDFNNIYCCRRNR